MMQGGLFQTKPTILWEVGFSETSRVRFRCTVEDLRMALNFLEPAPAKRARPAKKKAAKLAAVLSTVLTPEGGHRG